MKYNYRVFEDNGGFFHLFALNEDGVPVAGFFTQDLEDCFNALKNPEDPTEWDGQYGSDDCIDNEYVSEFDNYRDAFRHHIRESVKTAYATINDWISQKSGGAWEFDLYRVLPKYHDLWTDEPGDCIVSKFVIEFLADEWGKTVEELMSQVEEI